MAVDNRPTPDMTMTMEMRFKVRRDGAWGRLPVYKTPAFEKYLEAEGKTLSEFKKGRRYTESVKIGLIQKDEWTPDKMFKNP